MYSYQNIENERSDEEIDLLELIGMVFNHFVLVLVIVLVFSAFGVVFASLQSEKYDVTALVEIKTQSDYSSLQKYGIRTYTGSDIMAKMFSKTSIEKAIEGKAEGLTYEILENNKTIKYDKVKDTELYKITAENVEDGLSYVSIITSMVENANAEIMETYTPQAEESLKKIEEMIASITSSSYYSTNSSTDIVDLVRDKLSIESYINMLPSAVSFSVSPSVGEKNTGRNPLMIFFIFFLVGGVVGVIAAIVIDMSDNRIYSSDEIISFLGDKLIASIPRYKDSSRINDKEFSYIEGKLLGLEKKIYVTSLSASSGKTTIASALKKSLDVVDSKSIIEDPSLFQVAKENGLLLFVLGGGYDTLISLDKLLRDLKMMDIEYAFILNGVYYKDKNCSIYSDKSDYLSRCPLLMSKQRFYKK